MKYCCEDISKIENYELAKKDNFKGWVIHHRLELVETGAAVDSTRQDLKDLGLYYNRPSEELIYLTKSEHQKLHHTGKPGPNRGKHFSEEHKRKLLESKKGKKYFKGLYCIDLYDENNNPVKEEFIKGVNLRDLFNGLNRAVGNTAELDCSSAVAFQNKFRKGRDVKLTSNETNITLYAGNFNIDCSNDLVFRKKARAGRAVKLTNKDTKIVLYARIRELKNL